ncbi:MAG: CorA family divalent cation transporter, partial [Dehalococcoidia bacterium]|nr:CorA family divalent cation transporter [Dehalococcoidia bacterium]
MSEVTADIANEKASRESSEVDASQTRWFYVAQSPAGGISKGSADSTTAFVETLSAATIAWVDYVVRGPDFDKEALSAATQLGFSEALMSAFADKSFTNYMDFDTEVGVKLPSIQITQSHVEPYPLLLLMKKNFILTIHPVNVDRRFTKLRRYSDTVLKKIPVDAVPEDKLTLLLIRIVDENNDRNFEHLRQIEERGDALNEAMMDPHVPRTKVAPEIFHMKHALITYLNALWDTLDVLHALRYGDAELITN